MKANIAYKFELMPTREQKRIFAQAAGCRRFVWNKAIELQKRCLEQEVPFLKYTELAGRLVLWKKEDDMLWLQEAPSQALQQGLKDECASINEFKSNKKGFPKFHPSRSTRNELPFFKSNFATTRKPARSWPIWARRPRLTNGSRVAGAGN